MATLTDVKMWGMENGIGHIVQRGQHGWYLMLCGVFTPSFELTADLPKRKCRKCMENLKTARAKGDEYGT